MTTKKLNLSLILIAITCSVFISIIANKGRQHTIIDNQKEIIQLIRESK